MLRWLLRAALAIPFVLVVPTAAHAALALPNGFSEVTLASGLSDPTALAYAPDGRMFVTEKAGRLRVVTPGAGLAAEPVLDISGHVADQLDRGLLGLAVDPAFETNGFVYLLYTYDADPAHPAAAKTSRLTRIQVTPDNGVVNELSGPETVLLGTTGQAPCPAPSNTSDCIPSNSDSHSIGTVRADPDGTLWVGSGDGSDYNAVDRGALRAYNEQSMSGKILHIDRNGNGLPGHPFCQGEEDLSLVCTKLYAKGFRNPFRFQLQPGKPPVVGDVGWRATEELDFIAPGRSYGWPCFEGPAQTTGYKELDECKAQYALNPSSHTPPDHSYGHGTFGGAVEAGPQLTSARYPAGYRGAWAFGDYVLGWIKLYDVVGGKVANVRDFAPSGYRGVDLETTPEGDLVYVDLTTGGANSGRIVRVVYGNAPPPAVAHASPATGSAPLTVELSADESLDPDGDAVTYHWDVDGDGTDDATGRTLTHTYTERGAYTARLTVTDARGLSSRDSVLVAVDVTPPVATIEAPADGSLFRHGTSVPLRGSATDADEGDLDGNQLSWRILLYHEQHIHLLANGLTGAETSFEPAGDHDADSHYEVQMTATDSAGLSDTESVTIYPETIAMRLESEPPGVPLTYSSLERVAPALLTTAVGFHTTVAAPESVTLGGVPYRFAGWSDGGAREHAIVVPATDTTLTATYAGGPASPAAPAGGSGGSGGTAGSQAASPAASRLRFDRPARRPRVLSGRLRTDSAAPRVHVALRTLRSGGQCRRWSAARRRLGRRVGGCGSRHLWIRAAVTKLGPGEWRWKARLRAVPPRRRYVLTLRASDARGRRLATRTASLHVE